MTVTRGGTVSMSSTWSELRIRSPSKSNSGRLRGLDPVASTSALVPVISVLPSSGVAVTRSVRAAASTTVPRPLNVVTLRPLSTDSRPLVSRSITCCLRCCDTDRSRTGCPASTPNSLAPATVRTTSAVCSNSLAGMQPRWRHVPPTRASSIMPIESPAAAP
jgi:hypothetical protein